MFRAEQEVSKLRVICKECWWYSFQRAPNNRPGKKNTRVYQFGETFFFFFFFKLGSLCKSSVCFSADFFFTVFRRDLVPCPLGNGLALWPPPNKNVAEHSETAGSECEVLIEFPNADCLLCFSGDCMPVILHSSVGFLLDNPINSGPLVFNGDSTAP